MISLPENNEGPNHELFVKVLAQIEREPRRWAQGVWNSNEDNDCGTAYCFAGWTAALTGHKFVGHGILDGELPVYSVACAELGIDPNRDFVLFDGSNSLDDLYRISAECMGIDEQVFRDKVAAEVQS